MHLPSILSTPETVVTAVWPCFAFLSEFHIALPKSHSPSSLGLHLCKLSFLLEDDGRSEILSCLTINISRGGRFGHKLTICSLELRLWADPSLPWWDSIVRLCAVRFGLDKRGLCHYNSRSKIYLLHLPLTYCLKWIFWFQFLCLLW